MRTLHQWLAGTWLGSPEVPGYPGPNLFHNLMEGLLITLHCAGGHSASDGPSTGTGYSSSQRLFVGFFLGSQALHMLFIDRQPGSDVNQGTHHVSETWFFLFFALDARKCCGGSSGCGCAFLQLFSLPPFLGVWVVAAF